MDEQTAPPPKANSRPARRRWLRVAVALAALLGGLALLGFVAMQARPFWRPLPVVPTLPAAPASIVCPKTIEAVIVSSAPSLEVECPGGGSWYAPGERFLDMGEGPWQVTEAEGSVRLSETAAAKDAVTLRPNEDLFVLRGSAYHGSLTIEARSDGGLRAVNTVAPEQYIAGVVGVEMYPRWPLEALMAQAVVARTFMLHKLADRGYMVRTDMAYRGADAEARPVRLATELTRGIVLTYDDRLVPAYFQSTCGGHTVAVERAFAADPIPPLQGVDCPWCEGTRWYDWSFEVPGTEIAERLGREGLAEVRSIVPLDTKPDGYARFVLINDELKLATGVLRNALGGNRMLSARFEVTEQDGVFSFEGRGFGHGVGMCQWGARGMARAGRTWQEILLHYYPGAAIQKAY